jgi:hypothetical protein
MQEKIRTPHHFVAEPRAAIIGFSKSTNRRGGSIASRIRGADEFF